MSECPPSELPSTPAQIRVLRQCSLQADYHSKVFVTPLFLLAASSALEEFSAKVTRTTNVKIIVENR